MDINIIKEKAREYANGIHGITHKRTASVDFAKGAQFVLENGGMQKKILHHWTQECL